MDNFSLEILGFTITPSIYGLMYAISFLICYVLVKKTKKISPQVLEDMFLYIFGGVIIGGRLGYVLFYNLSYYIEKPFEVLFIWNGGMSFHGGVIGVILAMILISRKYKLNFYMVADEITRVIPIGLFFGRIGNYFNKELLGFPYTGPLSVTTSTGSFFPSPLLEALLEGIILFLILNYVYQKKSFHGQIAALFLIGYGVFRIFVEVFFRTPDAHIGYILPYISLGTILSFFMVVAGTLFYMRLSKKK